MTRDWQSQAQKGRDILANSIPKQWLLPVDRLPPVSQKSVVDFPQQSGLFNERELHITELSATALVTEMGNGKLSAEEVVVAFLKRAVVGHQLLNFATEFMADEAITRAKEHDEYYRSTGKLVGPLHGIPISVKEHVSMKNRTCNTGYVAWVDEVATEDAFLLQLLSKAGAIFHVRTNEPQSLMHLCCSNNITGTTLNPLNRTLSPGGSSGGEGASMGFRCAPLGIGSDIGGSIRCPAAFCGVYGFRPSTLRNPVTGLKAAASGQETIRGVIGPMASCSMEDLELFQRAVLEQEPWGIETSLMPVPWKTVAPTRDMTVAIMWDDGCVRPHPPITRALRHAKQKLVAAGVNVVDWKPYKHRQGWEIISALYYPDAASKQREVLAKSGEPACPLTDWAFTYSRSTPLSHPEAWALHIQRDIYRDEYHALLNRRGVDFILSPTYPAAAAVMGESQYWNYTAVWNLVDLPSVVFPSGITVDPKVDVLTGEDREYVPRDEVDKREWRKYQDPERYEGALVGLQLSGKRFKDEETLAAAKIVEEIVREEKCSKD
ncbi:Glutamyl-tRNA(Gln) amidotransferase subunit A, putative [Penicillium digitatum]|uniref:amidase n=3 Tax=Penicillium digitatum TaxID=36651 RepID=K9GMM3_PEND2|nr:Glutamyl-tRNA(Gln) amidotransferase subunit A, putative [Penicillium digitatum Pd1]EKV15948.1 Glutamyl-tRNA(Gln) amidotransferase subunit A, putative [Penicillium digitatum PHI26]EKV20459.1 Glutamyl-tRNA(Gln) amidotransferase subunit A, putative [Penicillium digitatum Pd1]QQK39940.1 Glutamyl-tRNA(Gln) amidotransferase subunit A, putative [Penicillium digitatum]